VLAVTHLPQVAACADHHLVVAKQSGKGGTTSSVAPVEGEKRVAEVARMLGGERLSGTTLAHAKEMLGDAAAAAGRAEPAMSLELVLITGMSGSGKSWRCARWRTRATSASTTCRRNCCCPSSTWKQAQRARRVAIAMDVRSATSLPQVPAQLRELMQRGVAVRPLFLDATTDTLVRRFSETRRRHPLSKRVGRNRRMDQHRAWSKRSSWNANCWPTCASTRTSSTPACCAPRSCRTT
jgi:hypothetical protein